jgi:hypothetical protein
VQCSLWYDAPNELSAGDLVTEFSSLPSILMMHGQTNTKKKKKKAVYVYTL